MQKIRNRIGNTVAIRPKGDFDQALAEARRLFREVDQKDDLLVSGRAWPHANPSKEQNDPMPIESLAETIIEEDDTGLILPERIKMPLSEEELREISEDLPQQEDCEAYFRERLKEKLAETLRASEIDGEQAKVLESIITSDIPLLEVMRAGTAARLKAQQETADAFAEALQEAGINLQPSIQRGL